MPLLKKIFFLSIFILGISLLFWGVYNLSFKKPEVAEKAPEETKKTDPPSPTQKNIPKVNAISDEAVVSPVLTASTDGLQYYAQATGKAFSIDFWGQNKKMISDKELIGFSEAIWSPDKNRVITKLVRPSQETQFFLYSYTEKKGLPLKPNLDEVVWHTNGDKILYKYYEPQTKERTLNIADPDGTNWTKLTDLNYRNVAIAPVPQSGYVSFWNKPDAFTETLLETIPYIGGEKKTILQGKFGADYLWQPSGNYILLSYVDTKGGSKIELGLMNYNGGEFKNLGVPTFISKCVWAKNGKTLYYALPGGLDSSAVLPNDYLDKKILTTDTFWKLNIETGEKTRVLELNDIKGKYDAINLFLNDDESMLFFVNRHDGKLYRIDI